MGSLTRYDCIDDKTNTIEACYNWNDMKIHKLKKINLAQFYIQLVTAILFAYLSIRDADVVKMLIAVLLVSQWSLGFWRHKIVRRRIKANTNPWTSR